MTEKDLKKLSRKQLLELLLKQTERADELERELSDVRNELADKSLKQSEAGSIAEEALKLNRVFEAAQAAAMQYVESIKRMSEENELLLERVNAEAQAIFAQTEERCAKREAMAQRRVKELTEQLRQLYKRKKMLDKMMNDPSEN